MIKVKGQLGEMAKCLEDEETRITDLAKLFFTDLSMKNNAIYNNLPGGACFFYFYLFSGNLPRARVLRLIYCAQPSRWTKKASSARYATSLHSWKR